MNKTEKTAFTIPELLIFLTIVGVVSVMMMTIIKPGEKYLPYAYYSAYNALSTAAFNIKEDANINNISGDETIAKVDKYFPGALDEFSNPHKELCKKLANKPNATDAEDEYGYINTTEYFCTNFTSFNADGKFPATATPAFRATNSMRFYISNLDKINVPNAMESGFNYELRYFVVWVDLNGDRRPNTAQWAKNKTTDIVPFVITTGGHVIPVGGPTIDARYATARLRYPSDSSLKYSPRSTTLLEAQISAYNNKEFPAYDPLSVSKTLYDKFKSEMIYKGTDEVYNLIQSKAQFDDRCHYTDGYQPTCSLMIDENSRL